MIDLVGYEPQPQAAAGLAQFRQRLAADHGAGWVGGAHGKNAVQGLLRMGFFDGLGRHDPAVGLGERDRHRLDAERLQDIAIGRIARCRDRHALPVIEQAQESQHEAGRGAGGHHHPLRSDAHAVGIAIVPGDPLAQGRDAERLGIADAAEIESGLRRLPGRARRRRRRLADLHVDDCIAPPLLGRGRAQHVHGKKGRHALHAARDERRTEVGG